MTTDQILLLVALGLVSLGAYWVWAGMRARQMAAASQSWPSVQGKVLSSQVMREESRNRNQDGVEQTIVVYRADVEYAYTVGTETFKSTRVQFGPKLSSSNRKKADAVVTKYPAGGSVEVFYDPLESAQYTLERTAGSSIFTLICGFVCFIAGVIVAVVAVRMK